MAHDQMVKTSSALTNTFLQSLPDGAQQSRDDDRTLISKTSPTVWEYEMFRIEWTRRAILRSLYEMFREDTRLQRSNHVFASTAVRRGFDIRITSDVSQKEAQKAQDIVNDFLRRVQFAAKLAQWARVLLRDGDLFLNPFVDPATRLILQIKSLPAISMQRNDDITGNFPDLKAAFQQIDPISLQPLLELGLWQINHVRWSHEDGERYGHSQYLGNLRTWRMLNMAEQDLVVRRRTRAAPKRVHIIGTPDRPGNQADLDTYMERNKLTGSQRDIVSDYFMNGQGDVKDLNADAQLDHIKDVEHIQDVHMLGTGVPLGLMGFGQNINRDVLEDQMKQFKEDVEELRRLMEYGDGSAYSGIRSLIDFQLSLLEIDPSILDYNIIWYEADNDTANDRVDRITKLRAAVPDPLLSRKTSLRLIAKDVGLDTDESVSEELEQIKVEQTEAAKEKQAEASALNPPGTPSPALTDATESEGVSENLANLDLRATGNNLNYPSRDDPHLLQIEQQIRTRVKGLFGTMAQQYVIQNRKRMAKLADMQPTAATGILDHYELAIDPYTEMLMYPDGCAVTDDKKTIQVNPAIYPLLADLIQRQDLLGQLQDILRNTYQLTQATVRAPTKPKSPWHGLDPVQVALGAAGISRVQSDEHGNVQHPPKEQPYKPSRQSAEVGPLARAPTPDQVSAAAAEINAGFQEVGPTLSVQDVTAQQLLEQRVVQHAAEIVATTEKMLAKSLTEALESGEPVDGWVKRALAVLDLPDWRADMIARTEVSTAFNEALKRLYRQQGVQQVRWVTHMDDKTCLPCAMRNGVVYNLDALPAIPVHPRCRCFIKPVLS